MSCLDPASGTGVTNPNPDALARASLNCMALSCARPRMRKMPFRRPLLCWPARQQSHRRLDEPRMRNMAPASPVRQFLRGLSGRSAGEGVSSEACWPLRESLPVAHGPLDAAQMTFIPHSGRRKHVPALLGFPFFSGDGRFLETKTLLGGTIRESEHGLANCHARLDNCPPLGILPRLSRLPGEKTMITQCAWCGHVLARSGSVEDRRITHTICLPCFESTCEAIGPEHEQPAPMGDSRPAIQPRKVA